MTGAASSVERREGAILAGVSLTLAVVAHFVAGEHSSGLWNGRSAIPLVMFPLLYLVSFALVVTLASLLRMRRFVDPVTRRLDVGALLRDVRRNPWPGALASLTAGYGITGSAPLVELYRHRAGAMHDASLWALEAPLFRVLLGSPLDIPVFWDGVYFTLWSFLFLVVAQLDWSGRRTEVVRFLLASVVAFHLTRVCGIAYPSAGPAFFRPELFQLQGTRAEWAQEMLRVYMRGELPQNGLIPGTMAMPSLHVGLAALAIGLWGRAYPHTLPWTLPWLALTWASTIFLGWHYAVDGLGGIALVAVALTLATGLLRLARRG